MPTQADIAQGYTIDFGTTHIVEATNFDLGYTVDELDVTSHDSINRTREFIPALITPQEVSVTCNYVPVDHDPFIALIGDVSATDTLTFVPPSNVGGFQVDAWVKGFTKSAASDGSVDGITITFRTTGPVTPLAS